MKKIVCFLFSLFFCTNLMSQDARAQGFAPELFGIGEIIIDYVRFNDPKTANTCGLTREGIANVFAVSFEGTGVPAVAALDAKPPMAGVARIQLIPQIVSHVDDSLNCISWISLTAESHANVVVPPISAPRGVTILYWRQHVKVSSSQALHSQKINEALKKMAMQFTQQYGIDQPTGPVQK